MDKRTFPTFDDMTSPYADYERGKSRERAALAIREARRARLARDLALYTRPDWVRPDYAEETQGGGQ